MTTQLPHTFRPNGGCMDCGAPAHTTTKSCDEYRDAGKMIAYKCTRCGATYEIAANIWFKRCKCGGTCDPIQPTTKGGDETCSPHTPSSTGAHAESPTLQPKMIVQSTDASNPAAVESNPPGDAGCDVCGGWYFIQPQRGAPYPCPECNKDAGKPTPATDTPLDAALNALCKACGFPIVDDRIQLLETVGKMVKRQSNELTALRADVARLKADGDRLDKYAKLVESEHEDTPAFEDGKWTTHHLLAPPPDCAAGVGTRRHKDLRSAIDAAIGMAGGAYVLASDATAEIERLTRERAEAVVDAKKWREQEARKAAHEVQIVAKDDADKRAGVRRCIDCEAPIGECECN